MPEMDGFEVLEQLKKNHIHAPVIVVLTNLSQNIDRQKCIELGVSDYIIKSETSAEDLWSKVKKYVPVQ